MLSQSYSTYDKEVPFLQDNIKEHLHCELPEVYIDNELIELLYQFYLNIEHLVPISLQRNSSLTSYLSAIKTLKKELRTRLRISYEKLEKDSNFLKIEDIIESLEKEVSKDHTFYFRKFNELCDLLTGSFLIISLDPVSYYEGKTLGE